MARVLNDSKGTVVTERVRIARSMWSRIWGLMGRRSLSQGDALLIIPCSSVHTVFMRFAIDVVFLDRENRVVKVVPEMRPFRAALGGRGAHSALELTAGEAARAGIEPGDSLSMQEEEDRVDAR